MPYYTYLLSSLPMLQFGAKPPFSYKRFLEMCEGLIPHQDILAIRMSTAVGGCPFGDLNPTVKKWLAFDTSLRNELVQLRARHKKTNPERYLRCGGYIDPSITHIALRAHRTPSLLEAEKILDGERWRFLGELAVNHHFDLTALIVYANRLLILERWDRISGADGREALDKILQPAGVA